MSLLQKYKKVVIPALFKRESGVLLEETISPIEHFGDDREFCKRLTVVPFKLQMENLCDKVSEKKEGP